MGDRPGAAVDDEAAPAAFRWSRRGVWLTAAALETYVLRGSVPGVPVLHALPFTVLEVVLLLTVVTFAVESWRAHRRPWVSTPFGSLIALLWVATAIAVVVSPDHRDALGIAKAYLVEPVLYFFVAVQVLRSAADRERLVLALYVTGLVVAVSQAVAVAHAVLTHTLNLSVAPPVPTWLWTNNNFGGIVLDPLVGLAAGLAVLGRVRWRRWHVAAAVVLAVGDVLTMSRGSWLALVAMALLLAALHPQRRRLLALCAVGCVVALLLPPIRHRVENELNFTSPANSLVSRANLWHATLNLIEARPVTGAGLAGYQQVIAPYRQALHVPIHQTHVYPDELILDFWVELGVLGFVFFLLFWGQLIALLLPPLRAGPARAPLAAALAVAWLGIGVHGLFDSPYWKNDLSVEWWALAALVVLAAAAAAPASRAPLRRRGAGAPAPGPPTPPP